MRCGNALGMCCVCCVVCFFSSTLFFFLFVFCSFRDLLFVILFVSSLTLLFLQIQISLLGKTKREAQAQVCLVRWVRPGIVNGKVEKKIILDEVSSWMQVQMSWDAMEVRQTRDPTPSTFSFPGQHVGTVSAST